MVTNDATILRLKHEVLYAVAKGYALVPLPYATQDRTEVGNPGGNAGCVTSA